MEGICEKERERNIRGIRKGRGEFVRQKERGRSTAGSNAIMVGEVGVLGVLVHTSHERCRPSVRRGTRSCLSRCVRSVSRVPILQLLSLFLCQTTYFFVHYRRSSRERERRDCTLPCDTRVILWVVGVVRQDAVQ